MLQCRAMLLAAVVLLGASAPLSAQQAGGTKAGTLACQTSGSLGLIFGSHQRLSCRFTPANGGPPDRYVGSVVRLGVDLGIRAAGVMIWAVIAPTSGVHHGALAGHYVGASADASLGLGAGAKVLIGGSHRSIALQPVSVEGQAGINIAFGVAGLNLRASH